MIWNFKKIDSNNVKLSILFRRISVDQIIKITFLYFFQVNISILSIAKEKRILP